MEAAASTFAAGGEALDGRTSVRVRDTAWLVLEALEVDSVEVGAEEVSSDTGPGPTWRVVEFSGIVNIGPDDWTGETIASLVGADVEEFDGIVKMGPAGWAGETTANFVGTGAGLSVQVVV